MREKPPGLHVSSVSKLEAAEGSSVPVYLCRVSAGFPTPASDYVDGEMLVKRLVVEDGRHFLVAENPQYPAIELNGDRELVIWGWRRTASTD